jgi:DNA-binding NtrC family response regulator
MKQVGTERVREATILVIVHEYVVRDILARILTAKGHKVVTCSVGFDGIRGFEKGKGKFHLVMIDINLPDVSGLVVAKKIKTISEKTPVILIRGWDKNPDAEELKGSGVDFIMSKPFYMDKTLDLVENTIEVGVQPQRHKG